MLSAAEIQALTSDIALGLSKRPATGISLVILHFRGRLAC